MYFSVDLALLYKCIINIHFPQFAPYYLDGVRIT